MGSCCSSSLNQPEPEPKQANQEEEEEEKKDDFDGTAMVVHGQKGGGGGGTTATPIKGICYDAWPTLKDNLEFTIDSWTNSAGTGYHPAICGILFGNEPDIDARNGKITGVGVTAAARALAVIDAFLTLEKSKFDEEQTLQIGIPISSGNWKQLGPGMQFYNNFVTALAKYPKLRANEILGRLIICMNVFASAVKSWIPAIQTYLENEYSRKFSGLLTEVGHSRNNVTGKGKGKVKGPVTAPAEFKEAVRWSLKMKSDMLGCCVFQYADKAWEPETSSEGSFGMNSQATNIISNVKFHESDFPTAAVDFFKDQGVNMESTVPINGLKITNNWGYIQPYIQNLM